MKRFLSTGKQAELAQRADRNGPGPGEAVELNYCLPGSRFAKIMQLARMDASYKVFRKHVPGIDRWTIEVAKKLVREQAGLSGGVHVPAFEENEPGERAG